MFDHLFELKMVSSVSKTLQDRTVSSQELWGADPACLSCCILNQQGGTGCSAEQIPGSKSPGPLQLAELSFSAIPVPVFLVLLLVFTSRAAAPTREH